MVTTKEEAEAAKKELETAIVNAEKVIQCKAETEFVELDHYSSLETIGKIMENAAQGINEGKGLTVRLYDSYGVNDPNEGKLIEEENNGGSGKGWRRVADTVYILCGTNRSGGKNRLDCWRFYGDDGKGGILRLKLSRKELFDRGVDVAEIVYEETERREYAEHVRALERAAARFDDTLRRRDGARGTRRSTMPLVRKGTRIAELLRWGQKDEAFQSEGEIRLITKLEIPEDKDADGKWLVKHGVDGRGKLRRWIEVDIQAAITGGGGIGILLGPRVPDREMAMWKGSVEWWAARAELSLRAEEVTKSTAPYWV